MNSTPTIQFENETTYHCLGDYDEDDVLCNNFTFTKNVATSPTTRTLFSVLVWSMLAFTCVLWYLCIRKERPERTTRGPFIKYFRQSGCQMKVTKQDIQKCEMTHDEEGGANSSNEDVVASFLVLSGKPSSSSDSEHQRVPNFCTICTESYKAGDKVVWSHDVECRHVFHRDCLIDYLLNVHGDVTPCPYCRRNFCSTTSGLLERNALPA